MNAQNTMITVNEVETIEKRMRRRLVKCIKEEAGRDWERLWREQKADYRKIMSFTPASTAEQSLLSRLVNVHENIREGVTALTGKSH